MTALVIAFNTFRETTRDRILAGVVAAGLVLLAVIQVASPLALGEGRRLTVDLGLSSITLLGFLVVLIAGTSLVAKEIERRSIYNLLSRPIARHTYLIGKWVGLSAALWVVAACLGVALWVVLLTRGWGANGPAVFQAVYLAGLELGLVTAVAVMFSAISTPALSALYTLGVYIAGQWSYDLRAYADRFPGGLNHVTHLFANLVPNLPLFNVRHLAASGQATSLEHLLIATLYGAVYSACALALATAAFESRDFK